MTDQEFANRLAKNIDEAIDLPYPFEAFDGPWLEVGLGKVVHLIPEKYRDAMLSVSDGIDAGEIEVAKEWLLKILDDKLPFNWFFTDSFKRQILDQIIDEIVKYLKLDEALAA